jgi:hypothetical protein
MSSIDGLRCITMDAVPINIILENLPKPNRITGFDINKINDTKTNKSNNLNNPNPKIFTFSPDSIKQKVE